MTDRAAFLRAANLPQDVLIKLSGSNAAANVGIVSAVPDPAQKLAIKQAFSWSIRNMWIFYALVGAIGVIASIFIKRAKLSGEHVETKTGLRDLKEEKSDKGLELRAIV